MYIQKKLNYNEMKTILAIALAFFAQNAICQIENMAYSTQFQEHNKEPYSIPTPNQSSLGTYGIIPVSPYTGKADISIPLYSISQRDVELNLSLTYDTSGLLINQLPGWTGQNWTLNAGGAITRKINGRPDEISYKNTNAGRDIFFHDNENNIALWTLNHFFTIQQLQDENLYDAYLDYIDTLRDQDNETVALYNSFSNYFYTATNIIPSLSSVLAPNYFDLSADVFYFNFMGISGSFFYGNDGKWKVRSDQNIHVLFDVNDSTNYIKSLEEYYGYGLLGLTIKQPKTIKGFTLIDEQGNKYIFGGDTTCIEYSTSLTGRHFANTTEPWNAVSWMLKEVQDRFGNTLYTFKYSNGERIVQIQNSYSQASWVAKQSNIVPTSLESDKTYSATLNAPVYLDSIMAADGTKILFNHTKIYSNSDNDYAWQIVYPTFSVQNGIMNMLTASYPRTKNQDDCSYCLRYDIYAESYRSFIYNTNNYKCNQDIMSMNLEKLKDIRVIPPTNQNGQELNNIFTFLYDNNNRMHLTSVICSSGSNYSNAYSYNLEYDRFDSIPTDYLTKKFDFWGYYNGVNYDSDNTLMSGSPNDTYLNRLNSGSNVPGVPNLNYGTMGMLKKITYPTGGYSVLEYEQNTCSSYMKDDKSDTTDLRTNIPVGGLRIKSISNFDNDVLVGKKSYSYNREGGQLSSGELYSLPKFHYEWEDNKKIYYIYIYNSTVPLSNAVSPIVGYSNVRETELDGSYTTYAYSNYSTEKDEMYLNSRWGTDTITPFDEFTSRQYMCGKLLEETKLNSNGDSLRHTIYTYESDYSFNSSDSAVTTCYSIHDLFNNVGSRFKMYYFRPGLTSVVSKTKYGNSWVTDEVTYNREHKNLELINQQVTSYADVWNVLSETRKRGSSQLVTEYRYPYHNTGVNHNLIHQFYLPVTSTKHYLDNHLIDGSKTIYRNAGNIVPHYDLAFASDSTKCDTVAQYISYSPTYRLTEMLDRNRVSHKYYWNNRDQLIGAVANGSINVNGTNPDINTIMAANSSVIYASKPTDALLYEYNNQGKVLKTVGGNGMSASYDYDLYGRLTKIKNTYGSTTEQYSYNYRNKLSNDMIYELGKSSVIPRFDYSTQIMEIDYDYPYNALNAEIKIFRRSPYTEVFSCILPKEKNTGTIYADFNNLVGIYDVQLYVDGTERISQTIYVHYY